MAKLDGLVVDQTYLPTQTQGTLPTCRVYVHAAEFVKLYHTPRRAHEPDLAHWGPQVGNFLSSAGDLGPLVAGGPARLETKGWAAKQGRKDGLTVRAGKAAETDSGIDGTAQLECSSKASMKAGV